MRKGQPARATWWPTGRKLRGCPLQYRRSASGVVYYRAERPEGKGWTPAFTSSDAVGRWLAWIDGCGPHGPVRHLRGPGGRTYCGEPVDSVNTDAPGLAECEGCFQEYAGAAGLPPVEDLRLELGG